MRCVNFQILQVFVLYKIPVLFLINQLTHTGGKSNAFLSEPVYRTPSAVSYWAHEDYTTSFEGTDNAITANITGIPAKGAEFQKIKLFLDTGVVLEKGKYYKVTAKIKAQSTQDYEICYNNGGIEMGYGALGGLRAVGGETQTIERMISVPSDKNDTSNLMLQFNLGKTTSPNAVTVSGVSVQELNFGAGGGSPAPGTVVSLYNSYRRLLEHGVQRYLPDRRQVVSDLLRPGRHAVVCHVGFPLRPLHEFHVKWLFNICDKAKK